MLNCQVGLHHHAQLVQVGHLPVAAVLALGVVEVTEHEAAQIVLGHAAVIVSVQVLEELVEVLLQEAGADLLQVAHEPSPV